MNYLCIICGSNTRKVSHIKLKADYLCCDVCELITMDPQSFVTREEEHNIYDDHQNSIDDPRYVAFFYHFLNNAVFPYDNGGKKGLDFGSGPSPVLAQILERFHGFDMDIYDYFYAAEKVYEHQKYDMVTCTEVVEHLKNPLAYFTLFNELLKPNGTLSIMTSFHKNSDIHFSNWHYARDKTHVSFYTPKTMTYLANKVGLKIIYTDNCRYTTFAVDNCSKH